MLHALLAFTNPTTNSYKRLVPGYEAPVNLAYSKATEALQSEYRCIRKIRKQRELSSDVRTELQILILPSLQCLLAGIDGIKNKIDPGDPMERDIYHLERKGAEEDPACS